MAVTKQSELKRNEKGHFAGGTPPAGFNKHPENRHNGAWKKEDTPRFKLEQMMKLSEDELQVIIDDTAAPLFERKLATAIKDGKWTVIKEMTQEVYGKPKESVDVTSKGHSVSPLSALTTEELRQAIALKKKANNDTKSS